MKQVKELRKRKTGGKQVKQTNHNKQAKTSKTDKPQQTNRQKQVKNRQTTANKQWKTTLNNYTVKNDQKRDEEVICLSFPG